MTASAIPVGRNRADAYDSREPLECREFPHLDRGIGVLASAPFRHVGLNAVYVDVSRETVRVSTGCYGRSYPAENAYQEIQRATQETINDLDQLIAELSAHRDRLAVELKELEEL